MNNRTSVKFKSISQNTNELASALLGDQDFLKMVTNLNDDLTIDEVPEVSPENILGNTLILTHVNEKILIKKDIKIFLNPFRGTPRKGSVLVDDIFEINILMPNEMSYNYKLRLNRFSEIANRIAVILDGQKITGIGEVSISPNFNNYKINEAYVGMTLFVTVINSIMSELDV